MNLNLNLNFSSGELELELELELLVRRLRKKVISQKNDLFPGSRLPLKSSPDAQPFRIKTEYIFFRMGINC